MAWSPYKDTIITYVKNFPGCSKYTVASRIARYCNPSKMYHPINTAIKHGWIFAHKHPDGSYALFPTKDMLWDYCQPRKKNLTYETNDYEHSYS